MKTFLIIATTLFLIILPLSLLSVVFGFNNKVSFSLMTFWITDVLAILISLLYIVYKNIF